MTAIRIGLDVGGSKVHGLALPADLTSPSVLAQARRNVAHGPEGVVRTALAVVDEIRAALPGTELVAVGVGIPGAVDDGQVRNAVNLAIAGPFDLRGALAAALGVPVRVDNDVNAAALGAASWIRSHGGEPDLALVSVGTGIAAGLVLDGVLRGGWSGLVGEVGHLPVCPDGPRCSCGQRGCLELYASGGGLARQWPYDGDLPQPVALFDAADAGDTDAVRVRETFIWWLAEAVRIITLVTDVRWVAVTGGVARLGARLESPLRSLLAARTDASVFAESMRLAERLVMLPPDHPTAAFGAAALPERTTSSSETREESLWRS